MNCTYDILRCVASHKARGIYIYNSLHAPYVPSKPSTYCVHVGASIGPLISNEEMKGTKVLTLSAGACISPSSRGFTGYLY